MEANRQLLDLALQRDRLADVLPAITAAEAKGAEQDVLRWYGAFVAMAIRRQADEAADVHSLAHVLHEMAAHPTDALDFGGAPIDLLELRSYRKALESVSKAVVELADKEVAHAAKHGPAMRPTFAEINASITTFESIVTRYSGYLVGACLLKQDASGAFIPVWLPGPRFEQITPATVGEFFKMLS